MIYSSAYAKDVKAEITKSKDNNKNFISKGTIWLIKYLRLFSVLQVIINLKNYYRYNIVRRVDMHIKKR